MNQIIIFCFFVLFACASQETTTPPTPEPGNQINTTKLINTPFEGMEIGDQLAPNMDDFLEGTFRTESITNLPIQVFLAYFTEAEEEQIQQGIDLANNAIGFEMFRTTETWDNHNYVIFKISPEYGSQAGFRGFTKLVTRNCDGLMYKDGYAVDWVIAAYVDSVFVNVIAHELGHAMDLYHSLIDYDSDTLQDLQPGSIMLSASRSDFSEYNFMMQKQGETIQRHLRNECSNSGRGLPHLKKTYQ